MFFRFQWEIPPEFQRRKCGLSTVQQPLKMAAKEKVCGLWHGTVHIVQHQQQGAHPTVGSKLQKMVKGNDDDL